MLNHRQPRLARPTALMTSPTFKSSKASMPSANAPACTSAAPGQMACTTWCGSSSTTRSTKRPSRWRQVWLRRLLGFGRPARRRRLRRQRTRQEADLRGRPQRQDPPTVLRRARPRPNRPSRWVQKGLKARRDPQDSRQAHRYPRPILARYRHLRPRRRYRVRPGSRTRHAGVFRSRVE